VRYHRLPKRVQAEVLSAEWEWSTARGERLIARSGDYRLTDLASREQWSVSSEALDAGYLAVGNGVYESHGETDARRIADGDQAETVVSREGAEFARPGDWVLRDSLGEEWVVGDRWFREHYSPGGSDQNSED
jgi:hypothetical protein